MVINRKYYYSGTITVSVYMWNPTSTQPTSYQVIALYDPAHNLINDYTKSFDNVRDAVDHMDEAARKLYAQPPQTMGYGFFI